MRRRSTEMEAPVVCDCGELFDLFDGMSSCKSNKVVCPECGEKERIINSEIEDIESEIDHFEFLGIKKREVKKMRKRIAELKQMLDNI